MYHKNKNTRTQQQATLSPKKQFWKNGDSVYPQPSSAMVLLLGFLRPASVSIYKNKKFNVRQLKVHPLATLKNKKPVCSLRWERKADLRIARDLNILRLSLFESARAMISKRFIKRANNLKPANCSFKYVYWTNVKVWEVDSAYHSANSRYNLF